MQFNDQQDQQSKSSDGTRSSESAVTMLRIEFENAKNTR